MNRVEFIGSVISEFLPIATFVVVSERFGFKEGLEALMVTATLAVLLSWFIEKRVPKFGLFASSIILFFGALSLAFHNPFFIIVKDSIYYGIFSLALAIGTLIDRSPFRMFFEDFFAMSERGWNILSTRWAVFFCLLAVGNELVRQHYSPEQWVGYKFWILIVTWIFGFYQFTVIRRERLPEANTWGMRMKTEA